MSWTRLRTRWRSLLAPSVAGRVDVHMAGYHRVEDARRVWLTIDGEDVLSCCSLKFQEKFRSEYRRLGFHHGIDVWRLPLARQRELYARVHSTADPDVREHTEFLRALTTCIGNTAEQLLASADPLVRALAMLDRRVGKRRLEKVDMTIEHAWVRRLHQLRCQADGVRQRV